MGVKGKYCAMRRVDRVSREAVAIPAIPGAIGTGKAATCIMLGENDEFS